MGKRVIVMGLVSGLAFPPGVQADPFKILGTRPLGMGGAYVAVAEDAIAQYWNPAGLATQQGFDLQLSAGAQATFTGDILKNANTLGDLASDYQTLQNSQTNGRGLDLPRTRALFDGLKTIADLNNPGKGALVTAAAGLNTHVGRMAVSVTNLTTAGANATVDTKNIGLGAAVGASLLPLSGGPHVAAVDLAGIDLSKNTLGGTLTTANKTEDFTKYTSAARDTLKDIIADVRQKLGARVPDVNLTDQQIANAVLNAAATTGQTSQQITDTVRQVNDAYQTVRDQGILDQQAGAYTNNQTKLTLRGATFVEIALGYAHPIGLLPGLSVGGNLKGIVGETGYAEKKVLEKNVAVGDILKDFTTSRTRSWRPAVDLGLLYDQRKRWRTKLGIVGRNLNRPKFDQPAKAVEAGESQFVLAPQVRAGLAFYPLNFWTIAGDVDLTNNSTAVPGYRSRHAGLGSEINLFNRPRFNIPLRVGLLKNLSDNAGLVYTAGFGLTLMHFAIEVGGAISAQRTRVKTSSSRSMDLPESAQVAVSLALLF